MLIWHFLPSISPYVTLHWWPLVTVSDNKKPKEKFMCRDSSVGIATRYGLDDPWIESRWQARFSAPVQTGPGDHPASYIMGTVPFPRIKRQGRSVDHPPPSTAEVKERAELYLYSPSGPSWPVLYLTFTSTFTFTFTDTSLINP